MKFFKDLWPSLLLLALIPYVMASSYPNVNLGRTNTWTAAQTFNVDTIQANNSGIIIGHTSQITAGLAAEFQILGTGDPDSVMILGTFQNAANGPAFDFVKSRGTAIGNVNIVADNDIIGAIRWFPADGSDLASQAATFRTEVDDGSPAAGDIGMAFVWLQMPGGGVSVRETMRLGANGTLFVGDNINTNMTVGLTINMGGNTDTVFALKSSSVDHGMTTIVSGQDIEIDDFYTIEKESDAAGGARVQVFAENTIATPYRLQTYGGAPSTTNTTASSGAIMLSPAEHDDANGLNDMAVNSNLFTISEITSSASSLTRLILKADDGELFLGLGGQDPTDFSNHNDIAIIVDMENFRVNGRLIADYATMVAGSAYANLVAVGLIGNVEEEDWNNGVRPLQSVQRSVHLLNGNARQERAIMDALMDVLEVDPQFRGLMQAAMVARGVGHLARQ